MSEETNEPKIIVTVPNQKVIKTEKTLSDAQHKYTKCNLIANAEAMQLLDPYTYKIYMYFNMNQNDYTFALSRTDVMNATGISKNTYTKAIDKLIQYGYLERSKRQKNLYTFHEKKPCTIICDTEKSAEVHDSTKDDTQQTENCDSRVPQDVIEIEQDRIINRTLNRKTDEQSSSSSSLRSHPANAGLNGMEFDFQSDQSDDIIFIGLRNKIKTLNNNGVKIETIKANVCNEYTENKNSLTYCKNKDAVKLAIRSIIEELKLN